MNIVQEKDCADMRNDPDKPDLKTRLIDAAEAEIAEKGLAGLKARAVTARAGSALGGLYTAFEDLDRLVLHVNSRTLARLGDALAPSQPDAAPETVMQTLAGAYARFALENRRLWSALFEHRLPEGVEMPAWHRAEHEVLIARIGAPLAVLRHDLSAEQRALRVRTLFGAVHGVVHLSLQERLVGLPEAQLLPEIAALVHALIHGSGGKPDA
ncbi:MAG TPA: TetR/AcrR family transcriptional regulator [Gemmobacter sp.]|nr:TetR/AcrR family transcriptional regulator [Gemmobacter sp.]